MKVNPVDMRDAVGDLGIDEEENSELIMRNPFRGRPTVRGRSNKLDFRSIQKDVKTKSNLLLSPSKRCLAINLWFLAPVSVLVGHQFVIAVSDRVVIMTIS